MRGRDPSRAALLCLAVAGSLPTLCAQGSTSDVAAPDTHLLSGGLVATPSVVKVPELKPSAPSLGSAHDEIYAAVRAAYAFDPPTPHGADITLPTDPTVSLMPTVVVRTKRAYGADVDSFLSDAGLFALQAKRFMGASTRFQDPRHIEGVVPNYAVLMYKDEKRARNLGELEDMASLIRSTGNTKQAKELQDLINDTFIRQESPMEDAMDRSVNWGRR